MYIYEIFCDESHIIFSNNLQSKMALISYLNQYYISKQIVFHVYQYKEKVYTSYREGISPLTNWLLLV